jgi:hypothetical protein
MKLITGLARGRIPEGTVITPQSLGPRVTPLEQTFLTRGPGLGMIMYPYWTMYPLGWTATFPAACASGGANFGWGRGVDISSANCGNGLCAGGSAQPGACGSSSGGDSGGGSSCGGGGCGGSGCGG